MASRGQDNNEVFKASIEKNLSALFGTKTYVDVQDPLIFGLQILFVSCRLCKKFKDRI